MFVGDPEGLFEACGDAVLCASPLRGGGGGGAGAGSYSTSLLLLTPSATLHSSLLDAVDALPVLGGDTRAVDRTLLALFPSQWSSFGTPPYLLPLPLTLSLSPDSLTSSEYELPPQTVCVSGPISTLFDLYPHSNLPRNHPVHAQLLSTLPSLAGTTTRRRRKRNRRQKRNQRLRPQARSSRLGH